MKGDDYFNMLQPITSKIPTLMINGNHDMIDNGDLMNFRFRFPGSVTSRQNNFYFIELLGNLFVFFNPDFFFLEEENERMKIIESVEILINKF